MAGVCWPCSYNVPYTSPFSHPCQDPFRVSISYHSVPVASTRRTATGNDIQCQHHDFFSRELTWLCEERVRIYRNNNNAGSPHGQEIRFGTCGLFLSWMVLLKHSLLIQQNFVPRIGVTLSPGSPDETRSLSTFITTCVAN